MNRRGFLGAILAAAAAPAIVRADALMRIVPRDAAVLAPQRVHFIQLGDVMRAQEIPGPYYAFVGGWEIHSGAMVALRNGALILPAHDAGQPQRPGTGGHHEADCLQHWLP